MRPLGGLLGLAGLALVAAVGCSRAYVAPVLPTAYTEQIDAPYDAVWRALVRALARENVQIRTIARDSGVIASEAVPTTIGLYADCGRFGEELVAIHQGTIVDAYALAFDIPLRAQSVTKGGDVRSRITAIDPQQPDPRHVAR